jgi:hypothetical protein
MGKMVKTVEKVVLIISCKMCYVALMGEGIILQFEFDFIWIMGDHPNPCYNCGVHCLIAMLVASLSN